MKLLFCTNCGDIFNIRPDVVRECYCGKVRGKYNPDGHTAVTNGEGISLGINNHDLRRVLYYEYHNDFPCVETRGYEWCRENMNVETWIRANHGPSNPRSEVDPDL